MTENKHYLCNWCEHKDTCDILKIYQVVVYDCVCLEYKGVEREFIEEEIPA